MAQEKRLIPIEEVSGVWSRKFMYNRQLIDHPLALQIPLMEAKDPEINVEFLKFKLVEVDLAIKPCPTCIVPFGIGLVGEVVVAPPNV